MLKHVSYRASSTSLSRPFGNCRASNTLSPQEKAHLSSAALNAPISAPNSPHISLHARHVRHHSITPNSDKYAPVETDSPRNTSTPEKQNQTYRRTIGGNFAKSGTLERTSEDTSKQAGHASDRLQEASDGDTISLKADDPLSRHKNDLRSVESLTLRGELMPDLAHHSHSSDSISLHSAISLTSLCRNDLRSSTTSLCTSKVPVRIHLSQLRPDIEYKTLRLDAETSCRQLIEHLLQKLRLKHRDPNLFAVVLEAAVRGPGGAPPVKKRFLLEDSARPVELQQCRPRGEANFSITMRRGGVLRVRDSVLTPGSQYKSFLVSYTSTVVEVIQLLLRCNNRTDDWRMFTLHQVCSQPFNDIMLADDQKPLHVQNSWPKNDKQQYSLVLRRHVTQGLVARGLVQRRETWRRLSMDECSMDLDVEIDEHNSTCSSILTTSSNSSRSRSSISSSTASVLSLASLSSNSSSRCSFSSNSSSGVSSGSSSHSSTETPEKDRMKPHKRQLPPTPVMSSSVIKTYPISLEENIQSYFSIPSDDERPPSPTERSNANNSCTEPATEPVSTVKRPPQPLPRRFLSFPAVPVSSFQSDVYDFKVIETNEKNKNFSKSWSSSSCYSPTVWIKARGPTAQVWQNRSRTARIRSATISTPVEHMANLSVHGRSRSSDQSLVSTNTLTSQPSTPTLSSPNSSKNIFSFSSSSLSRAQSTSSINSSLTSSRLSVGHLVVVPPSTKLRPLSLAPNSSIAFPSRPSSLLSTLSQSTSTLRASSSSLCLTTTSPDGSTNSSFTVPPTDTKYNSSTTLTLQNITPKSQLQPLEITTTHPMENLQKDSTPSKTTAVQVSATDNKNSHPNIGQILSTTEATETKNVISSAVLTISDSRMSSLDASETDTPAAEHLTSSSHVQGHSDNKHCPSCCRYDNCFYI